MAGKPVPSERRGLRNDKAAPWDVTNERKRQTAKAQGDRLTEGLAHINGICRGLLDVDYGMVVAVSERDHLAALAARADALARTLGDVKKKIKEAQNGG